MEIDQRPENFNPLNSKNPATPPDRVRAKWDRRVGDVVVQNHNWRKAAIALVVANVCLCGGLVVQSLKTQVIPYVVTVDKSSGEVEKAGAFVQNNYTPQIAEIKYFISNFISNARNIQLDPVQQQKTQEKAVAFLTKTAAQKFYAMQKSEGFVKKYSQMTILTKIKSIQKIPDTESYHVSWSEEEFSIQTGKSVQYDYDGVFSVVMLPVKDDKTLLSNPLGLYISDFNFTKKQNTSTNKK